MPDLILIIEQAPIIKLVIDQAPQIKSIIQNSQDHLLMLAPLFLDTEITFYIP